eukprot:scaffold8679_cov121-Isochrysis_galbana.AAC.13
MERQGGVCASTAWEIVLKLGAKSQRLAHRQKAPVVRVERVVAIVPEHKHGARRHPLKRQLVRGCLVDVWLVPSLSVDVKSAVANLNRVAAHGDDALDQRLAVRIAVGQLRVQGHRADVARGGVRQGLE